MTRTRTLPISGSLEGQLPNRYYQQETTSVPTHLAITFPGLGYHHDLPLLYYTNLVLLAHGVDVLQLRPDYQGSAFQSLSAEEQLTHLEADAKAGLVAGLAQSNYRQAILVGKSIGTLSMALLLPAVEMPQPPVTIWLTPLLRETFLVEAAVSCQSPSFFLVSTGDSTYIPSAMEFIRKRTPAFAFLAEGANHGLEVPGDPLRSLEILSQSMHALNQFLDRALA